MKYISQHLGNGDYLTQHGQSEMVWTGKGAARLGLSGQTQEEHFSLLCSGKHPFTGQKLGVRDKGANRRVCYFGQISAPKDVSIAYLVGGDERIAGWWNEAVEETLQEIEQATATRVRQGGVMDDRETGNMVLLRSNHKPGKLQNGDIVEVGGLGEDGSIGLKDGRVIPAEFRQFTYGYATTSHAAQGKTVDRGIVIMSDEGIRAGNLKQAYVSHSRFRETMALYVSDEKAAKDAFASEADRQLAMEMNRRDLAHARECERLFEQADAWKAQRQRVLAAMASMKQRVGVGIHID